MAKSKSEIIDDIQAFIAKHGNAYKEWYVSTSPDPKSQLFKVHGFKNTDKGLLRQAQTELQAAEVVEFLTTLGAKGGAVIKPGADYVYAYKRAPHTKP
jgi:hypothetical protein